MDLELKVSRQNGRRLLEVSNANSVEEGQVFAFELVSVIGPDGSSAVYAKPSSTGAAKPTEPSDRAGDVPRLSSRLPRDAATALRVLQDLQQDVVEVLLWRNRLYDEPDWAQREHGARRQAFSNARKLLAAGGHLTICGDLVSVSGPSAPASAGVSADTVGASASSVSAGPYKGPLADVADTPGRGPDEQ